MICPLMSMRQEEGADIREYRCLGSDCTWWEDNNCALVLIAKSLKRIAIDLENPLNVYTKEG